MSTIVKFENVVAVAGSFPVLTGGHLGARGRNCSAAGQKRGRKDQLLRACAGLLRINDGSAQVFGFDLRVNRQAPRRYIGLLGHENNLIEIYGQLSTLSSEPSLWWPKSDAAEALARVGLTSRLWSVPISALSLGKGVGVYRRS